MSTPSQKSLADITFSALKWDYAGTFVRAGLSFIINIILARLLGPEPFGLVAIAWIVIGLCNLVADLGMGPALVQSKTISDRDIRYVFTIQICMGMGLMIALALSAPLIGYIFHQPKVLPVVRIMSLMSMLQALGVTASSLLKRQMGFKKIQVAEICSYLVGYLLLGIPLALRGFEVWSLVIAQLTKVALFSALCYLQAQHPVKPHFVSASNNLLCFGSKVLLTNIVNWTIENLDSFFIGRFFDVVFLGLYSRAKVLVMTPMQNLIMTVQRVMFSSYSRMQDDLQTVQQVYLACVGYISLLMLPAYGCIALVPATVIHGLFGAEWRAAVPLLVPLALTMPFHAVMGMSGPILWSQNRVGLEFRAQLVTAFLFLVVLFVISGFSVAALAWGVFGISLFRCFLVTRAAQQIVSVPWSSLMRSVRGGIILLILTGIIVFISDQAVARWHSSAFLRLALDLTAGFVVFTGTFLFASKMILSFEMRWLGERMISRLPTLLRPLISRYLSLEAKSS